MTNQPSPSKTLHDRLEAMVPEPCPFCGEPPFVGPENPKVEGDAWGIVKCQNPNCVAKPSVADGESDSDDRGSDAYKAAAIKRWNSMYLLQRLEEQEARVKELEGVSLARLERLRSFEYLEVNASAVCYMCGQDKGPHIHTPEEIVIFKNGAKSARAALSTTPLPSTTKGDTK